MFLRNLTSNYPRDINIKGGYHNITLLAERGAGKTVFLAALARFPNVDPNGAIVGVEGTNPETVKLINIAQDILEQGRIPAGTEFLDNPDAIPFFEFVITIRASFFQYSGLNSKELRFEISSREYSGELFKERRERPNSRTISKYIDDCVSNRGLLLLILIDSTIPNQHDSKYQRALTNLQQQLSDLLELRQKREYRIAIAFSKCELSPAWGYAQNQQLDQFLKLKFSKTKRVMDDWQKQWRCSVNYFFCSSFGTYGGSPGKANVKRNQNTLAKPNLWHPRGIVPPLYWLATNKNDKRLSF